MQILRKKTPKPEEIKSLEESAEDSGSGFLAADDEEDSIDGILEKYKWLICFRGISNPTNERTLVGNVIKLRI